MLYRTLTLNQLMQLGPAQLKTALRLFDQELQGTITFLTEQPAARTDEPTLEELSNLLTLRKVFQTRLLELDTEGDELAAPLPASEQFLRNELSPALA